jgi:hypothetical protein
LVVVFLAANVAGDSLRIARAAGEIITFDAGGWGTYDASSDSAWEEGSMEVRLDSGDKHNSGRDGNGDAEARTGSRAVTNPARISIRKQDGSSFRVVSLDFEAIREDHNCHLNWLIRGTRPAPMPSLSTKGFQIGTRTVYGFTSLEELTIEVAPDRNGRICADIWVDNIVIAAEANLPPVADAGPDMLLEATSPAGATVRLNGFGSDDPDIDSLNYVWFVNGSVIATGPWTSAVVPFGTTTVTLRVRDPSGETDFDTAEITVRDTTPPVVLISAASPDLLWPPNHKLREVEIEIVALDLVSVAPTVTLVGVSSNEADDAPGDGDGETVDDIQGVALGDPDFDVLLRAERDDSGSGRVYSLDYLVSDDLGNSTTVTVEVTVPHDRRGR